MRWPPRQHRMIVMDGPRIHSDPKVMVGRPVIRGTRIPVDLLLRKIDEGAAEEDLLDAYPRLSRDDLQAARAFAAESR